MAAVSSEGSVVTGDLGIKVVLCTSPSRLESLGNRSLGGSWRLKQGSTSQLDSRLELLGGFLAARAQVWTRLEPAREQH